jgi:hypothetical protein
MNYDQLTQKEAIKSHDIDPLAILFFFLGALDIYCSLKRKIRERQEKYEDRLRNNQLISLDSYGKVALFALIVAAIIEIVILMP